MSLDATPRFGLPFLHAGQAQKEVYHNEALILADCLIHAHAVSAALSAPPASPLPGQCWIVGAGASDAWAGETGSLALWTEGGWRFVAPREGLRVRAGDEGLDYFHNGTGWTKGELRPDGLYISDIRVVGGREPAIAAPSGGSTVDSEARAAILAILNALKNHGLIEETE